MTEKQPKSSREKLKALRKTMLALGLNGYIVPRADEWQGEYVPDCADRLAWLTGFKGSAGTAAILEDRAALYSDSRYTEQIKKQVDDALYYTETDGKMIGAWIADHANKGDTIGFDPRLLTVAQLEKLKNSFQEHGIKLEAVEGNLVDAIWTNRPDHPDAPVSAFPEAIAGESSADKRAQVAEHIREAGAAAAFIAAPDSICWLLNVRGNDVPHVPVALSYALVHRDESVDWFVPPEKVPAAVKQHVGSKVRLHGFGDMPAVLDKTAQDSAASGQPVLADYELTPHWFKARLEGAGAKVVNDEDPCIASKARKTPAEQDGIKKAHIQDGVAMARFLKWVDEEAPKGKLTEIDVVEKLYGFRSLGRDFRDTSFDTIAGWAENGAVVHYNVNDAPEEAKSIKGDGLLLVDSGGQYLGEKDGVAGTTDITRTIAVGKPSDEMRENFTRVLQGHIRLARLRFPEGLKGENIDVLTHQALWNEDLDFGHGTGHGVGCYLSVHEDGTGISFRASGVFKPGMLVSNEPGYYKPHPESGPVDGEDYYGIRIENLIMVEEAGKNQTTGKVMLQFNTVSLAPIDRRLIVAEMLATDDLAWLNDYHERVFDTISPHLDKEEKAWLKQACAPIGTVGSATPASRSNPSP